MTPADLRTACRQLGVSQPTLAALCGVSERQATRWQKDGTVVPSYVSTTLEAYEHLPRLRAIEKRYRWLLEQHRPRFTEAEAMTICDALNGVIFPDLVAVPLLWANVEDRGAPAELVARLRALTPAESLAVIEGAENFWHAVAAGMPTDLALTVSDLIEVTPESAMEAVSHAIYLGSRT